MINYYGTTGRLHIIKYATLMISYETWFIRMQWLYETLLPNLRFDNFKDPPKIDVDTERLVCFNCMQNGQIGISHVARSFGR